MRLVLALLALFSLSTPALPATYNINITGQLETVSFASQGSFANPLLTLSGSDPFLSNFAIISPLIGQTSGSATYSDATRDYSNCTGLLTPFCRASPGFGFQLPNGDWGASGSPFQAILGPTNFNYRTDSGFSFTYQGVFYSGFGLNMDASVSSFSVSEVPIPAGVVLLLSGLGLLSAFQRRFKGALRWRGACQA